MHFKNPANGYIESSSVPFLWFLLFGSLYFAVKGVWGHAVVSFIVACCTFGLSWLIYPFFARGIVFKSYARRGWVQVGNAAQPEPVVRERKEPVLQ